MRTLIATPESIEQAQSLLDIGADNLFIGEDYFGLRLPHSFNRTEIETITNLAHQNQKKVTVAVNAIMHNERIAKVQEYLQFLVEIGVDEIDVGDPGVIHLLQTNQLALDYLYDAQVLVTSARQINFWANHGATGAVIAHEVPYKELTSMAPQLKIPGEVQVYGATAIHQSGRPLLDNYFDFVKNHQDESDRKRGLFISEPRKPDTHYSIYEDINGTHVFANNDLNLIEQLGKLDDLGIERWKLDGVYCPGDNYVQIVSLFDQARQALADKTYTSELAAKLAEQVKLLQPANRGLDTGFFEIEPSEVK